MKISVIVPVFNTAEFIDRCMTALLGQDYPESDYEVIVVDNGSSDDSRERLARFPVTVIREDKRGSYAARNAGVRMASASILAFTDSDCAPRADWLRTIEGALDKPGCLVVQGKRRLASTSPLLQAINTYEFTKDEFTLNGNNALKYYGYTNNMAMRREAYERFGPFVERDRGADTIFVRSVVDGESCDAVRYNPHMVIDHLEMNRFTDYLKKMFIYGRSRKRYRHLKVTEALGLSDRFKIFRTVTQKGNYSLLQSASFAGAMACSMATWQAGSWAGALESLRRSEK